MNILGLYSFTPTTTWLLDHGVASSPALVAQGLTLPDSRILNGTAGIGLTLAGIASVAPHLRRSMLDNIRSSGGHLAQKDGTRPSTGHRKITLVAHPNVNPQDQTDGSPRQVDIRQELHPDAARPVSASSVSVKESSHATLSTSCLPRCPGDAVVVSLKEAESEVLNEQVIRRQKRRTKTPGCRTPSNAASSPDLGDDIATSPPFLAPAREAADEIPLSPPDDDEVLLRALGTPLPPPSLLEAALLNLQCRPGSKEKAKATTPALNTSTIWRLQKRNTELRAAAVEGRGPLALRKVRQRKQQGECYTAAIEGRSTLDSPTGKGDTGQATIRQPASRLVAIDLTAFPKAVTKERIRVVAAEFVADESPGACLKSAIQEYPERRVDDVTPIHSSIHATDKCCLPFALDSAVTSAHTDRPTDLEHAEPVKRPLQSLAFIPQSIIRKYPSAPAISARNRYNHQSVDPGRDHQVLPAPRPPIVDEQALMLKERFGRTRAWASAAASEVRWRAPFLCRRYDEAERGPTVEKAVVMEAQPIVEQEQVRENQPDKYIPIVEGQPVVKRELVVPAEHKRITEKDPAMEQEPVIEQELPLEQPGVEEVLIVIKKPRPERVHPRRRLGVLARAALRDRRATVHGYGSDETDNPLSTDTESESERDFQSSSEPWVDEDALPETLGAKLVAAIDADGESEVDFLRSRKTFPALDVDDYSSASEDSVADLSLVAHGPSNIAISDTEIRVSSTSSPLNYEAIQQWVSRVAPQPNKQDATINMHRSRSLIRERPPSPSEASEASEACAERPTIRGISRCPLHGVVHGQTRAAAPAQRQVQGHVPPSRKPFAVMAVHNIPEFVPRQRPIPIFTPGHVVNPRRYRTTFMFDLVSDAAGSVITRLENQAGFNAQL